MPEINYVAIINEFGVAFITMTGAFVTGWFAWSKHKADRQVELFKLKNEQITQEIKTQREMLSMSWFVDQWEVFKGELASLTENTSIDRFLLLEAWNGQLDPQWTTAVFQYRQGEQEPVNYVHFELDDDYVDRLNHIVNRDHVLAFTVADLPESFIKSVYEAEGVKHAIWCFIRSTSASPTSRMLTYCSFATHDDQPFDAATVTRCRVLVNRLQGMALNFKHDDHTQAAT